MCPNVMNSSCRYSIEGQVPVRAIRTTALGRILLKFGEYMTVPKYGKTVCDQQGGVATNCPVNNEHK